MKHALITLLLIAAPLHATETQEVRCSLRANLLDQDPSGTNVRSGAGRDHPVIGRLPTDRTDAVSITAARGNWVKISGAVDEDGKAVFAKAGWVYAPLLGMTTSWNPHDRQQSGAQNLHAAPAEKSPALGRLPAGASVTLEGCQGRWAKVNHQGKSGWLAPGAQCTNSRTECS